MPTGFRGRLGTGNVSLPCEVQSIACKLSSAPQPCRWSKLPAGKISGPGFSLVALRGQNPSLFSSPQGVTRGWNDLVSLQTRHGARLAPQIPMPSTMGNAASNNDKHKYRMKPAQSLPLTEKCQHYTDRQDVPPELEKCVPSLITPIFVHSDPRLADTGPSGTPSSRPTTTASP